MKTQKRNFVVEIKSSRRRLRAEPKSIWGDTDFKALSREAEAAHFLMNGPRDAAKESSDEQRTNSVAEAHIATLEVAADVASAQEQLSEVGDHAMAVTADVTNLPIKPKHEVGAKRSRKIPLKRENREQDPVSPEQLSSLQEENDLLTGLLAKHLREQNLILRSMLERFG